MYVSKINIEEAIFTPIVAQDLSQNSDPEPVKGMGHFNAHIKNCLVGENYTNYISNLRDGVTVWAEITINEKGHISNLTIANEVEAIFSKLALKAIKSYRKRWIPGMLNGKMVKKTISFPIIFD